MFKVLTSFARDKKGSGGTGEAKRTCVCPRCGDSFETDASGRFCSDPCRTAWLRDYGRRPEQLAV